MPKDDPRKVGETWYSHYWNACYTILARDGEWFNVRWDDGTTTSHCTAFNPRDKLTTL